MQCFHASSRKWRWMSWCLCNISGVNMPKSSGRTPAKQQNMHASSCVIRCPPSLQPYDQICSWFVSVQPLLSTLRTLPHRRYRNAIQAPGHQDAHGWMVVESWLNHIESLSCQGRSSNPSQTTEMSRTSPALPSSRLARRDLKGCLNQDEINHAFMNNNVNTWSTSKSTAVYTTRCPVEDTPLSSHKDSMLLIKSKISKGHSHGHKMS